MKTIPKYTIEVYDICDKLLSSQEVIGITDARPIAKKLCQPGLLVQMTQDNGRVVFRSFTSASSPYPKYLRAELAALLKRYHVSIDFCCDDGSDLYGVTGEHIAIVTNEGNTKVIEQFGYSLYASDLLTE